MLLFASALTAYSWQLALISFDGDIRSLTSLQTPLFVPQSMMALGFTTLGLEAVLLLAEQIARLANRRSNAMESLGSQI
jgi:hypothetical protein